MKEILGSKSLTLKGKLIVLGITGSVAAVKSFEIARELVRHGAIVQAVMSPAALELVGSKLIEFATGNAPITEISGKVEHVKFFGKKGKADLFLIAPATANTISKIAMGIDDTPITTFATTAIGSKKPVLLAPAMHEPMYNHPIVKENLEKLKKMKRVKLIDPLIEEEKAKISAVKTIVLKVQREIVKKKFCGKKVLIATGTTQEKIDPIRLITTNASGKTGEKIAMEAFIHGAEITLLHNKGIFLPPIKSIKFQTAKELHQKTIKELKNGFDYFFCPAAIGDFDVKESKQKITSNKQFSLQFFPRAKLLQEVRKKFPKLFIVGFKAVVNVSKKQLEKDCIGFLEKHRLQMVVGNDAVNGVFGSDKNEVVVVSSKKSVFLKGKKDFIAKKIIEQI